MRSREEIQEKLKELEEKRVDYAQRGGRIRELEKMEKEGVGESSIAHVDGFITGEIHGTLNVLEWVLE